VGLWKNIRKGWSLFCSHTRFELGDESKIRFWNDVWCGKLPLKVAFLALYVVAREKNAFVADHLDYSSGSFQWMSVLFVRLMIGSWTPWPPFSPFYIPFVGEGLRKTSFGGSPPTRECSMLDPFTRSLCAMMLILFLGRAFGRPKLL
jgi:hypothetical protein